jgi:hypothetical protein
LKERFRSQRNLESCLEGEYYLVMEKVLIRNIKEHKFHADEHLLPDANVWLYTYGPSMTRSGDRDHIYNDAMTKMIANNCKLYIIPQILSEYVHVYLDKQLALNGIGKDDLKAFRKTDNYKEILRLIEADLKEILGLVKCCNPMFEDGKACVFLDRFLQCTLDFNDVIIEDFCISNPKIILVTNDGDFKNCNIPIVTANECML